jgi:hypothetical protein
MDHRFALLVNLPTRPIRASGVPMLGSGVWGGIVEGTVNLSAEDREGWDTVGATRQRRHR